MPAVDRRSPRCAPRRVRPVDDRSGGAQTHLNTMNLLPRRRLSLTALTAIVALWCLLVLNLPLWSHLLGLRPLTGPREFAFLLSFAMLAGLIINLFLTPLTLIRPLAKPLLAAVLVLAAAASYFIDVYGAVIDKVMIRNVLETNATESTELLSGRMLLQVALLGVLPSVLVFRTSIAERGWRGELRDRGIAAIATLALLGGIAPLFYQDYASLLRNHRELRHMLVPVNFLAGLGSHIGEKLEPPQAYTRIGEDARRPDPAATGEARKPLLVVLVVGETARAANFQLGGYARPTNPALSRIDDLVYFRDVSSCGTSTAISVPCLFSDLGRAGFDAEDAKHRDNLIDISLRAGLDVHWFGNNTDCKGVCRTVPERRVDRRRHPAACVGDHPCLDGALFEDFFGTLDEVGSDRFTVIQTLGSHGPGTTCAIRRNPSASRPLVARSISRAAPSPRSSTPTTTPSCTPTTSSRSRSNACGRSATASTRRCCTSRTTANPWARAACSCTPSPTPSPRTCRPRCRCCSGRRSASRSGWSSILVVCGGSRSNPRRTTTCSIRCSGCCRSRPPSASPISTCSGPVAPRLRDRGSSPADHKPHPRS